MGETASKSQVEEEEEEKRKKEEEEEEKRKKEKEEKKTVVKEEKKAMAVRRMSRGAPFAIGKPLSVAFKVLFQCLGETARVGKSHAKYEYYTEIFFGTILEELGELNITEPSHRNFSWAKCNTGQAIDFGFSDGLLKSDVLTFAVSSKPGGGDAYLPNLRAEIFRIINENAGVEEPIKIYRRRQNRSVYQVMLAVAFLTALAHGSEKHQLAAIWLLYSTVRNGGADTRLIRALAIWSKKCSPEYMKEAKDHTPIPYAIKPRAILKLTDLKDTEASFTELVSAIYKLYDNRGNPRDVGSIERAFTETAQKLRVRFKAVLAYSFCAMLPFTPRERVKDGSSPYRRKSFPKELFLNSHLKFLFPAPELEEDVENDGGKERNNAIANLFSEIVMRKAVGWPQYLSHSEDIKLDAAKEVLRKRREINMSSFSNDNDEVGGNDNPEPFENTLLPKRRRVAVETNMSPFTSDNNDHPEQFEQHREKKTRDEEKEKEKQRKKEEEKKKKKIEDKRSLEIGFDILSTFIKKCQEEEQRKALEAERKAVEDERKAAEEERKRAEEERKSAKKQRRENRMAEEANRAEEQRKAEDEKRKAAEEMSKRKKAEEETRGEAEEDVTTEVKDEIKEEIKEEEVEEDFCEIVYQRYSTIELSDGE